MIRLFLIFLILLISVGLGVILQHDPGYVLIAIHHWTIETTVWVALFGLVLLYLILKLITSLISTLFHIPSTWRTWRLKHRRLKAREKTEQGLIEFGEGQWQEAKIHLLQGAVNSQTPLLNYLTAAKAAQEMGDDNLRDQLLAQAKDSLPGAELAIELTQVQLELKNQQWDKALRTLKHLQIENPYHPQVLKLLSELYLETQAWSELYLLLPILNKHKIYSKETFQTLQYKVYLKTFQNLLKNPDTEIIDKFLHELPKHLKLESNFTAEYANFLIDKHEYAKSEALLRGYLKKQFNPQLVEIYSTLPVEFTNLNFIETLLKNHANSSLLLFSLGKLCMAHNLWGKARVYLEESLKITPTSSGYLALGRLLEQLNDIHGASQAYQSGLNLALSK